MFWEKLMWWKLGALTLLAVGFVVLLMMPIGSVDIVVEMPRARANGSLSTKDVEGGIAFVATAITYGLVAAVLALIGWLMWRVIRHHRSMKDRE
jgi:hypothetical protein